jgi:hypothetical protein
VPQIGKKSPLKGPGTGPIRLTPPSLQPSAFQLFQSQTNWRTDWTHIVAGHFSASPFDGLLFYEQSTGVAEFWATDGQGNLSLLKHYDDWRTTWTLIVPGVFGPSGFTGLLLYDQAAGYGAIFDTDGAGNLKMLFDYHGWLTSWTQIVAGHFTTMSPFSGLLFYDQSAGFATIYSTDGQGRIKVLASYDDWRTGWTTIIAGVFDPGFVPSSPSPLPAPSPMIDGLFFYEGATGYCETYQTDGAGGISMLCPPANLPIVTHVVPGIFGGLGITGLMLYDATANTAAFYEFWQYGVPVPWVWITMDSYTSVEAADIVVPGNFWVADPDDLNFVEGGFTDLLFYTATLGRGDFYLHEPADPTPIDPFAGYVSDRSVLPGESVGFSVSSQVGPFAITIYRLGLDETPMGSAGLVPSPAPLPIGRTAYKVGAQWPECGSFQIPDTAETGLYVGRVTIPPTGINYGAGDETNARRRLQLRNLRLPFPSPSSSPSLDLPFVVRAPPSAKRSILFAIADNTYEAYNYWGGRSHYGYGVAGQQMWTAPVYSTDTWTTPVYSTDMGPTQGFLYGFRVSFQRGTAGFWPQYQPANKWKTWELPFLQWLDRQGVQVDLCVESDLHFRPDVLEGYRLLVIVGHSEYWSGPMRDTVENFTKAGGNVAFFAGNVCFWQVRFDDDNTMVCYKWREFDPASQSSATLPTTTVNWSETYLHRPETNMTGVHWSNNIILPTDRVQFTVLEPDHWVFANTGLSKNCPFGLYADNSLSVVSGETDCHQTDSPANFQALAFAGGDPPGNIATMGVFSPINGFGQFRGVVFTAAVMNWTLGLSQDGGWNPMDQITRNVLTRLG